MIMHRPFTLYKEKTKSGISRSDEGTEDEGARVAQAYCHYGFAARV
jgi:hypothetical protein